MDNAWNLQVESTLLSQRVGDGSIGNVYSAGGTKVEGLNFSFSDPYTEVGGQVSHKDTLCPIFQELAVRQALNLPVPRQLIAADLYAEGEESTANVLADLDLFESPNTGWRFDLKAAAQAIKETGRELGGDVRVKDDIPLEFSLMTATSTVRQKTQAIVKDAFEQIELMFQIDSVDSAIFFESSPGNRQNFYHVSCDMGQWNNGPYSPIPITRMNRWYDGSNGENIVQAENDWQRNNTQRYQSAEYDAMYEALLGDTDGAATIEQHILHSPPC
jgi:peptide/nickel transport system substrate-binding protein